MFPDEINNISLQDYRILEVELHRDLMIIYRKYINHLNIISIVGILDICKQEAIELDRAARRTISSERADICEKVF